MCQCMPDRPYKRYVRPASEPAEVPQAPQEAPAPQEEEPIPVDWPIPVEAPVEK